MLVPVALPLVPTYPNQAPGANPNASPTLHERDRPSSGACAVAAGQGVIYTTQRLQDPTSTLTLSYPPNIAPALAIALFFFSPLSFCHSSLVLVE